MRVATGAVLCFKALAVDDEAQLTNYGSNLGLDTNFMSVLRQ